MGPEPHAAPDGDPGTGGDDAPPEDWSDSAPFGLPPPGSAVSASDLSPIAEKADDLAAIKQAVADAASVGGGLWFSYLFVLFYLAVAAGAVTHADLFLEKPVRLPFLNVELPLLAFFLLAPILFIVVHAYTLLHLAMLAEKAKRLHQALHDSQRNVSAATRENLQWQLPSNIFIQFLSGPAKTREGAFGWALRAIGWITLVIGAVLLLLLMQIQFLPHHSSFIAWTLIALAADLALIWWLWRTILSGREIDGQHGGWGHRAWMAAGFVLTLGALLFSGAVATFPGEWQETALPSARIFPAIDSLPARSKEQSVRDWIASYGDWIWKSKKVSLHDWVFNSPVDPVTRERWLGFSSTLVLTGFNIYEGLGVDDPEKVKLRDFVVRARGRDLKGAIFAFASLPRVDFDGANLEGASLSGAQLQGASLNVAELQGASLDGARLEGASLAGAKLQGAVLNAAQLEGAMLEAAELVGTSLIHARLEGASLAWAKLRGAVLAGAQLQGAVLNFAQLEGASLVGAQLQGASLDGAQLQGARLSHAQLQGARLQQAILQAVDLSNALLWRTNVATRSKPTALRLSNSSDPWLPSWYDSHGNVQPWSNEAYQRLQQSMDFVSPADRRNEALERLRRLDCVNPDKTLAACDPSLPTPAEASTWRKALDDARADDAAYREALAAELKTIICSGGDDAIYILRGVISPAGRFATGSPESAVFKDMRPALIDFIMSKDCPVSNSLTAGDKDWLLNVKQAAIQDTGG